MQHFMQFYDAKLPDFLNDITNNKVERILLCKFERYFTNFTLRVLSSPPKI